MTFAASLSLFFAALLLGALAAAVARRGGMKLYALEGIMLCGGLTGVLFSHEPVWVSLPAAGGAGAAAALLWGAPLLRKRRNHALAGLAFNGFAAAGAMIAAQLIGGVSYTRKSYWLEIAGENVTVFLPAALSALLIVWLLVHHTRFGLRLRLCGQSGAPERMGVRVRWTRGLGLALSGLLGGLGGLSALLSLGAGWRMAWGVCGLGYAALALAFAGKHGPFRILGLALLLALLRGGAEWLGAPESVLFGLPILAALILLAMAGRKRLPAEQREDV
jgi:simple sugar transport system permease protein